MPLPPLHSCGRTRGTAGCSKPLQVPPSRYKMSPGATAREWGESWVSERARCSTTKSLTNTTRNASTHLPAKHRGVSFVRGTYSVTNCKGLRRELKIGGAFRHVRAAVHEVDAVAEMVPAGEDCCPSRATHRASTVEILQHESAVRLCPLLDPRRVRGAVVVAGDMAEKRSEKTGNNVSPTISPTYLKSAHPMSSPRMIKKEGIADVAWPVARSSARSSIIC